MLYADYDGGCAYTDSKNVLYCEGDAETGELFCNALYATYETDSAVLRIQYNSEEYTYNASEEGWDSAAAMLLHLAAS